MYHNQGKRSKARELKDLLSAKESASKERDFKASGSKERTILATARAIVDRSEAKSEAPPSRFCTGRRYRHVTVPETETELAIAEIETELKALDRSYTRTSVYPWQNVWCFGRDFTYTDVRSNPDVLFLCAESAPSVTMTQKTILRHSVSTPDLARCHNTLFIPYIASDDNYIESMHLIDSLLLQARVHEGYSRVAIPSTPWTMPDAPLVSAYIEECWDEMKLCQDTLEL